MPPTVDVCAEKVLEPVVDLLPLGAEHDPLPDGDPLRVLQVLNALLSLLCQSTAKFVQLSEPDPVGLPGTVQDQY